MNEFVKHIAEVEGVKTPKGKRSKKEVQDLHDNFVKEQKTKRTAKAAKAKTKPATATAAKKPEPKKVVKPVATQAAAFPLNHVSETGYVRGAAFDPKGKMFYVAFAKSTWAFPATADEWKAFEKAIADAETNIDSYYRKAFRGRTSSMISVRHTENGASKEAPRSEVK